MRIHCTYNIKYKNSIIIDHNDLPAEQNLTFNPCQIIYWVCRILLSVESSSVIMVLVYNKFSVCCDVLQLIAAHCWSFSFDRCALCPFLDLQLLFARFLSKNCYFSLCLRQRSPRSWCAISTGFHHCCKRN
jgi:hypothetical protein